jgi:hypothetical protein
VIAALLDTPATSGLTLELVAGEVPVTRAAHDAASEAGTETPSGLA